MATTVPVRRPAMTAAVLTSLEQLTRTTPSTGATELGLRYLRHLVTAERSPEIREKRAKFKRLCEAVQARQRHHPARPQAGQTDS